MTNGQNPPENPEPSNEPPAEPSPPTAARPQTAPAKREADGAAPQVPEKDGFKSVTSTVGRILRTLFAPLVWVLRPLVFRIGTEKGNPKVYFTSFSTLLYLWPIMVVGVLGCWLVGANLVGAPMMGWIWITVMLTVLIAVGADTDRNKAFVIGLIITVLWVLGLLLKEKHHFPVLSHIYDYFAGLGVAFDSGTAKVFSVATCVILVFVVAIAWFDGRYEITTREITHRRVFRTSDSLPRAAKRIKRDWRDLMEVFLGIGAGDVIVLDSNMNIVMRISNVPFLWFFRHDIDHILEVLATTEIEENAAIEEDDLA
jgi:hypothetical protein